MSKLSDYAKSLPLYPLPHHLISRLVFWATRQKTPLKNPVGELFIKAFGIDLSEAVGESIEDYDSFNDFFTRALKAGARPIAEGESTLASPVDGTVSQSGKIKDGRIFQAKGQYFSTLELLGGDPELTQAFNGGQFATLYLSPRDYHRIHMPTKGVLKKMIYIPGRLFSVAGHTVRTVPRLFARNERVVTVFETERGPIAMILVGAINVAAIETVWAGLITPGRGRSIHSFHYEEQAPTLEKGQEMGRFNMGSTVILLTGANVQWDFGFSADASIKMGQSIGRYND
ncbi:phosphatidylserine decarboxylase [gamma proteobacterium HTCC5015]|nr:phosphatidylserine decarboxylase [gamma proteobacterium HTCC5015]